MFLHYDCPLKLKRAAKWSEFHYIYFVLGGKKTLQTADGRIDLTAGSVVFIRKGACIVEQYFDEPFCVVVFIIPDSFIVSFLDEYMPDMQASSPQAARLIIPVHDDLRLSSFYQSIIPYFGSQEEIPESLLELKFKELILSIIHNPQNEELRNFFLTLRNRSRSPIHEIMEANYAYNLRLEDYAKLSNRSVSSFKRDFQSLYKTTPGRWLMEKKLAHAKRLLARGDMSISDVAFESGFENKAHFSRLFKQRTGHTPMGYRKMLRERSAIPV